MKLTIQPVQALQGTLKLPGDKSITHRALLLSALADGASRITGYLDGEDCRATMGCLRTLGAQVERHNGHELVVRGHGWEGWRPPHRALDCVRSGTTMRLLAGLLAGQPFDSVLGGEPQLLRRPMQRIITPLEQMGGRIEGREGGLPPLAISGRPLHAITYELPMASAQVKSAILLAGLRAQGETTVVEPGPSRDHTERMLRARGVAVESEGLSHRVTGPVGNLNPLDTRVPGDFSSAAYFLVAAAIVPDSEVTLWNIGINPTRTGLLDVLREMGAEIVSLNRRDESGEPVADLWVRAHALQGVEVGGELVPRMIDEFPILALAATQAEGTTVVRDAAELRVKETDRIATTVESLRALGAQIEGTPDGFVVEGPTPLIGAPVNSHGDHRLAMTLAIAGCMARGETIIHGAECIGDSFPGFQESLYALTKGEIA
jgi:3-phosphoshikimate 1-carboxyvinyltransferase